MNEIDTTPIVYDSAWFYKQADEMVYAEMSRKARPFSRDRQRFMLRCIYWVELDGEVLYVGQSHYDARTRLKEHYNQKGGVLHDILRSSNPTIYWMPIGKDQSLTEFESLCIRALRPKLNTKFNQ